jgi:anti-sigma factor RsiW
MTHPSQLSDADLGALADGQLSPERVAAIEAALLRDPEAATRLAAMRGQNASLRRVLDPWLAEPIPQRLLDAAVPPSEPRSRPSWRSAAAVAASLVVGVAIGWFARDAWLVEHGTPTSFAQEAAFSHAIYTSDPGRPVEIEAKEGERLVRWLTRRIGVSVNPPDLSAAGYALVGGRLLAGNEKPTGLLMYENADKRRLTLQWRKNEPGAREVAFRYAAEGDVGILYWIDRNCAYALSGNVDRTQLFALAHAVDAQLTAGYIGLDR